MKINPRHPVHRIKKKQQQSSGGGVYRKKQADDEANSILQQYTVKLSYVTVRFVGKQEDSLRRQRTG